MRVNLEVYVDTHMSVAMHNIFLMVRHLIAHEIFYLSLTIYYISDSKYICHTHLQEVISMNQLWEGSRHSMHSVGCWIPSLAGASN